MNSFATKINRRNERIQRDAKEENQELIGRWTMQNNKTRKLRFTKIWKALKQEWRKRKGTYLEVEWRVEAITNLGDLRLASCGIAKDGNLGDWQVRGWNLSAIFQLVPYQPSLFRWVRRKTAPQQEEECLRRPWNGRRNRGHFTYVNVKLRLWWQLAMATFNLTSSFSRFNSFLSLPTNGLLCGRNLLDPNHKGPAYPFSPKLYWNLRKNHFL